ncbi:hypothetical protein IAT40_005278 [Kwoniella sp. CBS 6097]
MSFSPDGAFIHSNPSHSDSDSWHSATEQTNQPDSESGVWTQQSQNQTPGWTAAGQGRPATHACSAFPSSGRNDGESSAYHSTESMSDLYSGGACTHETMPLDTLPPVSNQTRDQSGRPYESSNTYNDASSLQTSAVQQPHPAHCLSHVQTNGRNSIPQGLPSVPDTESSHRSGRLPRKALHSLQSSKHGGHGHSGQRRVGSSAAGTAGVGAGVGAVGTGAPTMAANAGDTPFSEARDQVSERASGLVEACLSCCMECCDACGDACDDEV